MNSKSSEISADYIYSTFQQDEARFLKSLLKKLLEDYENPACDYVIRQCRNVKDLESFLKDYSHLFIVEGDKVAKYDERLETGQESANAYFEEKLLECNHPMSIKHFMNYIKNAPDDIQYFMKTFYPESEFKRYLLRRPHLFHVSNENIVCLAEKVCAEFFRKIVKQAEGIRFMSLRGKIGQAPEHIRKYINNQYPGTAFRNFVENNCDLFRINSNGLVFLAR